MEGRRRERLTQHLRGPLRTQRTKFLLPFPDSENTERHCGRLRLNAKSGRYRVRRGEFMRKKFAERGEEWIDSGWIACYFSTRRKVFLPNHLRTVSEHYGVCRKKDFPDQRRG